MSQVAYSIGQMAEELAVHPQTLRNWEREGLITPPRSAGQRVYLDEERELLHTITRMVREEGLRVTDIRRVLQLQGIL